MRRTFLISALIVFALMPRAGAEPDGPAQSENEAAAIARLGLIAGPPASSETMLAADMASLFTSDAPLRVLPMLGDAGTGNITLLLDDPSVDVAFVSADALAQARAEPGGARLTERLELVARLCPQEIHVLARGDIGSLADLAGKTVNFGPAGSGSASTAASFFKALGIAVEPLGLDAPSAVGRLKRGAISAVVLVGGKPLPLAAAIPANLGIHLLPIPFSAPLDAAYLPTRFAPDDYPGLIRGGEIPTLATGMLLLAAKSKGGDAASTRLAAFVGTFFPRFAALKAPDRHPKWREINLAASVPGLARTPAAEAWLAKRPSEPAKSMAATMPGSFGLNDDEKEDLFKKFMEWQRAKGH